MRIWKRTAALAMALAMCLGLAAPAVAVESATTVQLMKHEGTVSVTKAGGKAVSVRDRMRLYSGYKVATRVRSAAWISLDDAKLAKLDAAAELELRKSGKKIELLLNSGNLFFNVTKPLDGDETMNIRTSTMAMGIRGTCGWVEAVDAYTTVVSILEGKVECTVFDPVSGRYETTVLTGGQTAEFVVHDGEISVDDRCEILMDELTEAAVPGFVLVELVGDDPKLEEIYDGSGLDLRDVTMAQAVSRQSAARAAQAAAVAAVERAQASQPSTVLVDGKAPVTTPDFSGYPYYPMEPAPTPTPTPPPSGGGGGGSGGGGSGGGGGSTTYKVSFDANGGTGTMADVTGVSGSYNLPTSTFTEPTGKEFKGWSTSSTGDVLTSDPTVSADTTLYAIWKYSATQALSDLQNDTAFAILPGALNDNTGTVTVTKDAAATNNELTIPAGKTLNVANGKTLTLGAAGSEISLKNQGTVNVSGTLNVTGTTDNSGGTINVTSNTSFHATGLITNSGTLSATVNGLIDAQGGITNVSGGTVKAEGSGEVKVTGTLTNGGTVTVDGHGKITGAVTNNGGVVVKSTAEADASAGTVTNSGWLMDEATKKLSLGSNAAISSTAAWVTPYAAAVTTVDIGANVTSIDPAVFSACTALTTFTVDFGIRLCFFVRKHPTFQLRLKDA